MAKKTSKKTISKTTKKAPSTAGSLKKVSKKKVSKKVSKKKTSTKAGTSSGKKLVIVESPAKAKTINKYLGSEFVVKASVGHIRDLPSKNPKGVKSPVPGVDLENNFEPAYEVLSGKSKTVSELKKLAKSADEIWFATDLDREGEAISWHLAHLLGVGPDDAKRVVFNAITKSEITRAFAEPRAIDQSRVDAQQARRILDRIVGYQVSPLLWKKVARGLSAGRVQSVAVRLVVERERAIRAHVPGELWRVVGRFTLDEPTAMDLVNAWPAFMDTRDEKGNSPTVKAQNAFLGERGAVTAELAAINGEPFDVSIDSSVLDLTDDRPVHELLESLPEPKDLTPRVAEVLESAGLTDVKVTSTADETGRGPARMKRSIAGTISSDASFRIKKVETKHTKSRPPGPFITSTLQQSASSRLGFGAQRTMRAAQRLYEGVEVPGEGAVGLITYMRTDSTHLSGAAIESARAYIDSAFDAAFLPEKPNFFASSNKAAQEAHEAIRPTDPRRTPEMLKGVLQSDEWRLYDLIWRRFVACQMAHAEWDATNVEIEGGKADTLTFVAKGRVLAFDGFYKVAGVPLASDEQTLPALHEGNAAHAFAVEASQKFTPPPARYSEASLIKTLESEGIGRPSTYASIISVIQARKYVENQNRRLFATDLGEVVTDKLTEAFPDIMGLGYTREMENTLDSIESEQRDWRDVLRSFYEPFRLRLTEAEETLTHAKAETKPAPFACELCGAPTVYRFGKNGMFLSCSRYPDCKYASPIDREGKPKLAEWVNIRCPKTGRPMIKRDGRFGVFIATHLEEGEAQDIGMILNLDKKNKVKAPAPPALLTDLECPKCGSELNLREGVRGPWLGCSKFPKCRGRGKWAELEDAKKKELELALKDLLKENPIPIIHTLDGVALTDEKGQPLADAPTIDDLLIDDPSEIEDSSSKRSA